MKLSVIIPVYNAENSIKELVEAVRIEIQTMELEIVLIDDGSKDGSERICEGLAREKDFVKFISLRRNFGEHNAVMCGLNYCIGDLAVIVDDDFQNPPSEIMKLVSEAEKGFDVVYSKYNEKKHTWFRNFGSKFNDYFATKLINKPADLYLSSFKVINRPMIDEIIRYKGPFPYVDGLLLRATDNITSVLVAHENRKVGKSNYTMRKLMSLYLNMFLNFSIRPLRIFTVTGFIVFVIGFIFSILFILEKIIYPATEVGWTSLIVAVITFSGFQIMFLGLIGEYLGKQYLDQNRTPQWVVKKEMID
ncbi:MAG: glycosyltransferase family 2 protein [Bacteroidetes bacterium]|nr:glycosyltransferase family 2 protein [Bacteroidota bacterium]